MKMADIWNEKPKSVSDGEFPFTLPNNYDAPEMDAWLEKVKSEVNRLNKEGLEHYAIAVEYYEKLEAIEKHTHDAPTYGLNFVDTYEKLAIANADWHLKLLKILSSEFTTKDEEVKLDE